MHYVTLMVLAAVAGCQTDFSSDTWECGDGSETGLCAEATGDVAGLCGRSAEWNNRVVVLGSEGAPLPTTWSLSFAEADAEYSVLWWESRDECPAEPTVRLTVPATLIAGDHLVSDVAMISWGAVEGSPDGLTFGGSLAIDPTLEAWIREQVGSASVAQEDLVSVAVFFVLGRDVGSLDATFDNDGVLTNYGSSEVPSFELEVSSVP